MAKRVIASGTDYRVELASGRYVVGVGQAARLVTVSSGRVTTADLPASASGSPDARGRLTLEVA